jgi:predicted ester cyclase
MKNFKPYSLAIFLTVIVASTSCNQQGNMEERNKAMLIKTHDELFTKGNLAFADESFTNNYAGQGPEFIKGFVTTRRDAFPDYQYNLDQIVAERNLVSWIRTNTGTHTKDYMGFRATGKKVTWKETVTTLYDNSGKIAEEWAVSDATDKFSNASGIEGVLEYLPPNKGKAIMRNGQFIYLIGSADGKNPMFCHAGKYEISGETMKNTIRHSTDPKQIGNSFLWKVKLWSGDTLWYEIVNEKGEPTGGGSALKVSN